MCKALGVLAVGMEREIYGERGGGGERGSRGGRFGAGKNGNIWTGIMLGAAVGL